MSELNHNEPEPQELQGFQEPEKASVLEGLGNSMKVLAAGAIVFAAGAVMMSRGDRGGGADQNVRRDEDGSWRRITKEDVDEGMPWLEEKFKNS